MNLLLFFYRALDLLDIRIEICQEGVRSQNFPIVVFYCIKITPQTRNFSLQTFDMSFYFRLRWKDERITRNGSLETATTNQPPSNLIWTPDISVTNALTYHTNEGYTRLILKTNGDVFTSERYNS